MFLNTVQCEMKKMNQQVFNITYLYAAQVVLLFLERGTCSVNEVNKNGSIVSNIL